jgi:hypothetical protein
VLDVPDAPELPRVTALPVDVGVDPEYVAPLPRELPPVPRSPLLTCDPFPLVEPPPPPLLPRGTADVPLKPPPLEDPALLPPEDPPDEPPDDPAEDPADEPLDEPPDEPPAPCVCWADETVGVPSRNIGTSTASA